MNAQPITLKSSALLGLLLAVSAFNLSALPDQKPTVITRTLSSVDTCDLESQLDNSETPNAACKINQGNLKGKLSIKKVTVTKRDWNGDDDAPVVKTTKEWEVSLETECTTGCAEGTFVPLARNNAKDLREALKFVDQQKKQFSDKADRLDKEEREAKDLAEKKDNCELDANGKEFASDDKALNCKVGRVAKMGSREKAAEYFQTEIQPQLQALITCDTLSGSGSLLSVMPQQNLQASTQKCTQDRSKAAAMLKQLGASKNAYIKQATTNMNAFGQYAVAMDQMTAQSRYAADPQYKQALQQHMQQLQQSWGGYFAQQGLAINQTRSPMDWDSSVLDYNQGLMSNLQGYDASFNNLANMHSQMLGLTNNNAQAAAGQGRLGRGQTVVTGGPQVPATIGNGAQVQPAIAAQQQAQPLLNANRAATPGTVNIIKPAAGSPVLR